MEDRPDAVDEPPRVGATRELICVICVVFGSAFMKSQLVVVDSSTVVTGKTGRKCGTVGLEGEDTGKYYEF